MGRRASWYHNAIACENDTGSFFPVCIESGNRTLALPGQLMRTRHLLN